MRTVDYITGKDAVVINREDRRQDDYIMELEGHTFRVRDAAIFDIGITDFYEDNGSDGQRVGVIISDPTIGLALAHPLKPAEARQAAEALIKAADEIDASPRGE